MFNRGGTRGPCSHAYLSGVDTSLYMPGLLLSFPLPLTAEVTLICTVGKSVLHTQSCINHETDSFSIV
jgi:hypothetical protein